MHFNTQQLSYTLPHAACTAKHSFIFLISKARPRLADQSLVVGHYLPAQVPKVHLVVGVQVEVQLALLREVVHSRHR